MNSRCPRLAALAASWILIAASDAIAAEAFVHTAAPEVTAGSKTTLNHPSVNNQPGAIIFVSQVFGAYNANPPGVRFDRGRWTVVNMNNKPIPRGTKYNVLVFPPNDDHAFVHVVGKNNIRGNQTLLSNPAVRQNPRVMPIVTPRMGAAQQGAIGTWWDGTSWTVFNQNRNKKMTPGVQFNVLAAGVGDVSWAGARGHVHRVTEQTKTNGSGKHISALSDTRPDLLPFVTMAYGQNGVYNDNEIGLWFDSGSWTVFNQNRKALPDQLLVNVLVVDPARLTNRPPPNAGMGRPVPIPNVPPGFPGVGKPGDNTPPQGRPAPLSQTRIGPLKFHAAGRQVMCMSKVASAWGKGTDVFLEPCNPSRPNQQAFVYDSNTGHVRPYEDLDRCMFNGKGKVYFDSCSLQGRGNNQFDFDKTSGVLRIRRNPKRCVRMANQSYRDRTPIVVGRCLDLPRDAAAWTCARAAGAPDGVGGTNPSLVPGMCR